MSINPQVESIGFPGPSGDTTPALLELQQDVAAKAATATASKVAAQTAADAAEAAQTTTEDARDTAVEQAWVATSKTADAWSYAIAAENHKNEAWAHAEWARSSRTYAAESAAAAASANDQAVASKNAAAASATAAAASAATAGGHASTSVAQAGYASTSATTAQGHAVEAGAQAAAAGLSATAASASATTATTQAGQASTSATAASGSQAAAAASAAAASTSATAAAGSATGATASATAAAASAASAAAVVTGGTASLAPTAGKIPLADAAGKIDLLWLGQDAAARINMIAQQINHIGVAGAVGFGVGICPTLTAGFTALAGTYALGSDEYGNYRYSDGSIMVWVPAFYYRIGHVDAPTYARDGANAIEVRPISAFADRAAATAAGWALHRAFIDGGEIVPGFMHDKYRCSNNSGTASSIKNGAPLSSAAAHNPFSGLTGAPSNAYGGAFAAAKTRGGQFFPASRFMRSALALLSLAHGQAANTNASCAWFDAARTTNFPKGNNNNAFKDTNDTSVTYTHDGYASGNCGLTGSGAPSAKTTHNGQACGIADLNGNMYTIEPGLTCIATSKTITAATQTNPVTLTVAAHGLSTGAVAQVTGVVGMTSINDRIYTVTVIDANTLSLDGVDGTAFAAYTSGGSLTFGQFYIAKEAAKLKTFTGGATLATDHFGATGVAAMMEPITLQLRTDYPNNGFAQRFGNAASQVLDPSTSGAGWQLAGLGLPKALGASSGGTSMFGQDYFYQHIRNELCPISGMYWGNGANAGAWAVPLLYNRTNSSDFVGFCAASYPVRPSGNEA